MIINENKEKFYEFDYDRFEKQLGDAMDRLLGEKAENIEKDMERRDIVEMELLEEKEENTNERLNDEQDNGRGREETKNER